MKKGGTMSPSTLQYAAVVISKITNKKRRENYLEMSRNVIMYQKTSARFKKFREGSRELFKSMILTSECSFMINVIR